MAPPSLRRRLPSLTSKAATSGVGFVVACLLFGACSAPASTASKTSVTTTSEVAAAATTREATATPGAAATTARATAASTTAPSTPSSTDPSGADEPAATPSAPTSPHARVWYAFTGLIGPTDEAAWRTRLERACDAPIWEAEPAARLARELLVEDGGDPDGPSPMPDGLGLERDAVWTLWFLALNSPDGCRSSFPTHSNGAPYSAHVVTWHNFTGQRPQTSLEAWTDRLGRACDLGEAGPESWERLATEIVVEDGGDPDAPAPFGLVSAVEALQIMTRPPGACDAVS